MSFRSPKSPAQASTSSSSGLKRSDSSVSLDKKTAIAFEEYEGSEFEFNADGEESKINNNNNNKKRAFEKSNDSKFEAVTAASVASKGLPSKSILRDAQAKEEGQIRAFHYGSLNAYSKHKKLVNDYIRYYSGGKSIEEVFKRDTSKDKTDLDVIREEMKFIWDDDDRIDTWEKRLAKKYYDKLFKEYCICDLTFYKQNKIAMRWRIEREVIEGKGQFICGDKRCLVRDGLKSWEVNFGYMEHNEKKNALVKLRLCPECSVKLNYHHQRREVKKPIKTNQKASDASLDLSVKKRKAESSNESSSSSSDEESNEKSIKEKVKKTKSENVNNKEEPVIEEATAGAASSTESKSDQIVETKDGNMIILGGGDSMWKKNTDKSSSHFDESKMREDEFESYLEDLLL